jgi:hypothetical protein
MVDVIDLCCEEFDDCVDVGMHGGRGSLLAFDLGGTHLNKLPAPVDESLQLEQGLVRKRSNCRPNRFPEVGQDIGVDGIRFCELAKGLGEVANQASVDDNDWELR